MATSPNIWRNATHTSASSTIMTSTIMFQTSQSMISNVTTSTNLTTGPSGNVTCGECPCDTNVTSGAAWESQATTALQVYYPTIVVVGILGNIINLCVLTQKRFLNSSSCIFLIGLAGADIFVLIFETGIKYTLLKAFAWTEPHGFLVYLCVYNNFLLIACVRITFFITVAFTIERYINIKFPVKARSWCTAERAKKTLPCLFVGAFVLASHQLFLREARCGQCTFVDLGSGVQRGLTFLNASTFIIVFILLIVFNGLIIYELRQNSVKKFGSINSRLTTFRGSNRITVLLVIVSVTFLVIWLPWLAVYLGNDLPNNKKFNNFGRDNLQFVAQCTSGLNSAVNFFLYSLVSQRFRTELKRSFWRLCGRDVPELRKRKSVHPYYEAINRLDAIRMRRGDKHLSTKYTNDARKPSTTYISPRRQEISNDTFIPDDSDDSGVGRSSGDLQTPAVVGYRTVHVVRQSGPGCEIVRIPEITQERPADLTSGSAGVATTDPSCSLPPLTSENLNDASMINADNHSSLPARTPVENKMSYERGVLNGNKVYGRKRSHGILSPLFRGHAQNKKRRASAENYQKHHRSHSEVPANMSWLLSNSSNVDARANQVRKSPKSLLDVTKPTVDTNIVQEGLFLDIFSVSRSVPPSSRRRRRNTEIWSSKVPLPTPPPSPRLTSATHMTKIHPRAAKKIQRRHSGDLLESGIPLRKPSEDFSADSSNRSPVALRDCKVASLLRAVSKDTLDSREKFEIIETYL